jgi:hypothetical protein
MPYLPNAHRCSLLLVGGTFNEASGRPSGYFRKFAQAVREETVLPVEVINGGNYHDLLAQVASVQSVTHLFWFADIPNELPKILPGLKNRFPHLTLIQSKNNRAPREYTRLQLVERMRASDAAFLLEFTSSQNNEVLASLLTSNGEALFERIADIREVAQKVIEHVVENATC